MSTKEKESAVTGIDIPEMRKLILFNSGHFWEQVILQLQKATGFDVIQCEQIAIIAHTKGKAVVKSGGYEELAQINSVLREINLITEIK
ncbi:MAG: ATP-dependent Clp protease adaptor ClpS [Bacteroidetes bacterium]|nr:ATP-dependent Clp protease adaptor ClpS [Bacteroidota bacterium]